MVYHLTRERLHDDAFEVSGLRLCRVHPIKPDLDRRDVAPRRPVGGRGSRGSGMQISSAIRRGVYSGSV